MIKKIKSLAARAITLAKSEKGYCPICEQPVRFIKTGPWLRQDYRCLSCKSIPRYRALIDALKTFFPRYRDLHVHESSPNTGASSSFLKKNCKHYSASQYFPEVPRGQYKDGFRSEDLTQLTLDDNSVDLLITQDVFEHVMEPEKAFREIARILKPGGAHLFSMPWYPSQEHCVQRAKLEGGQVVHLEKPIYHGNPVDRKSGSLVTYDWGLDFTEFIFKASGLVTTVYLQRDPAKGIDGKFLEIFVSRKMRLFNE
jgi:SAM-dependent methyltransferase